MAEGVWCFANAMRSKGTTPPDPAGGAADHACPDMRAARRGVDT